MWGTIDGYGQTDSAIVRDEVIPLMWAVRERANELGAGNLRGNPPVPGLRELRLWYGFGLYGTGMIRMWESPSGWRVCQYLAEGEILRDSSAATRQSPIPSEDIAQVWKQAVAEGLLELPPAPRRPKGSMQVADGHSWVLEWYDGKRYGAAGADNPETFESPDDQQLEKVVDQIAPLWRRPLPMCKNRS